MEEILEECESIIDEVCEKYNYDRNDTEGNDSLRTVLLKAVPAMLMEAKKEDRELFYQMLKVTPIVVTENLTQEGLDKLKEKYIGNVNPHIQEEEQDLGEYGKSVAAGAYISEPIMSEDMQIKGKKSFVYVQKLNHYSKAKEFFGTDINVSHLIHELGHAWHAERNQYQMTEDGRLLERIGTAQFKYSFFTAEDGRIIRKNEGVTGLFIEEGMNTIEEEKAMGNYMGISQEEMKKAYNEVLVKSVYQGIISDCVKHLVNKTSKQEMEKWRLYGDQKGKDKIQKWMEETKFWRNRESDILPASNSKRNYDKKRSIISEMDNPKTKEFFEKYESIYFPDIFQMAPFEKLENALEQFFNLKDIKYTMEINNYSALINIICWESYALINQTADVKAKEEIMEKVKGVKQSEVKKVILETKQGLKDMQEEKNERQGESK